MAYTPKLNPQRGCMIEKLQPITKQDISLVQRILDVNDEIVIGVGDAEKSHDQVHVMTAGERIELADHVLQASGVDPNRYMIIPIRNSPSHAHWVANVRMVTPHWDTLYTCNFKNATMFDSFKRQYGYNVWRVPEQKPEIDHFASLAQWLREEGDDALAEFERHVPIQALDKLTELGVTARVNTIYNRADVDTERKDAPKRALFLGGLQPPTGVWDDRTGHLSVMRTGLEHADQLIIAIGSAQESLKASDPLTVGKRIDVVRYALQANGVDASRFYVVPVFDISANACYASEVITHAPAFTAVVAGNDWTKQLFGEGNYAVIPIERNCIPGTNDPISGSKIRNIAYDVHRQLGCTPAAIARIEEQTACMMDPHTLAKLREVGYYDIMSFLAKAKE